MTDKTHLVIYGNGTSGVDAEPNYRGKFDYISHRDAQNFDRPKATATHFALECFHTDQILNIRKAYLAAGKTEASANMPEATPKESSVVAPAPKTRRKRRTKAEIEADQLAEADNDGTDNDTRGE